MKTKRLKRSRVSRKTKKRKEKPTPTGARFILERIRARQMNWSTEPTLFGFLHTAAVAEATTNAILVGDGYLHVRFIHGRLDVQCVDARLIEKAE